jgi:hypothetical protein
VSIPSVKLRDTRKPGHCWQDNELYDCFQPVIGALAVGVYVRLTRECYGTTIKINLRFLADLCGISKSAVQRAFAVMEMVGIVVVARAAAHRSPEYELADLKELAIGYDAEFNVRRCSYILKPEILSELRAKARELKRRTHSIGVPMGDTKHESADEAVSRKTHPGVPQNDSGVPQTAKNCDGNRLSNKARIQEQIQTPLPPLQASGDEIESESYAEKGNRSGDGRDGAGPAAGAAVSRGCSAIGIGRREAAGVFGVDCAVAAGHGSGESVRRFRRRRARDGPADVAFVHQGPGLDEETIRELQERARHREARAG